MTRRPCPECGGSGRDSEPMDKFEKAEYGGSGVTTWESRCECCRGHGYILFGMMYPTVAEFKAAWRDWIDTEIVPEMKAYQKKLEDPVFVEELKVAAAENLKRTTAKRKALVARVKTAIEKAIKEVGAMK